jgi:ectoine hydroxylase-related dioxygenase (phytanoyl-CoA dioxygenase family)
MQILQIARANGWVRRDVPLKDAIVNPKGLYLDSDSRYLEIYNKIYKIYNLHALLHYYKLLKIMECMLQAKIMIHPRITVRMIFPCSDRLPTTTPAHQDFIHVQGTPETYTVWIPLSDIPIDLGGLQINSGSHRHGVYAFRPALGGGGVEIIDHLPGFWVSNPFLCGDVLFFHSLTVHKGLPNQSARLRLSVDARFQKMNDPICRTRLLPVSMTWEEVYADWPNTDLKYYWKNFDLNIVEFDPTYQMMRDQMAIQMAEVGDIQAISTLRRIAARDSDPDKRKLVMKLLAKLKTEIG